MKINNNNLNDVLHVVGVAISNTDYNRDCFSVSEVHLYSIIWKEVSLVLEELFKSGVNFDKFIKKQKNTPSSTEGRVGIKDVANGKARCLNSEILD